MEYGVSTGHLHCQTSTFPVASALNKHLESKRKPVSGASNLECYTPIALQSGPL